MEKSYKCTCCGNYFKEPIEHGCNELKFQDMSLSRENKNYKDEIYRLLNDIDPEIKFDSYDALKGYIYDKYKIELKIYETCINNVTGFMYGVIDHTKPENLDLVSEDFGIYPDKLSVTESGLTEALAWIHLRQKLGRK